MADIHLVKKREALVNACVVDNDLHLRYDSFTLVMSANEVGILLDAICDAENGRQKD